jgi:mono/diheme cytochrome c family protein
LVIAVVAVLVHGYGMSEMKIERRLPALTAATDSVSVERGRHLAQTVCAGCHSSAPSLTLTGSPFDFFQNSPMGTLYAPNLTSGGELEEYSDAELARAIREGIDHHGRPLFLMPSGSFHGMSDRDLRAIIGYLRSQPSDTSTTPPRKLKPLAYLLLGLHLMKTSAQPAITGPVPDVPEAPTSEYGRYLTPLMACKECHNSNYRGHKAEGLGPPPAPDILAVAHRYPLAIFDQAVRGGISPTGKPLNPQLMPWPGYSNLTDTELVAIYQFLKTLP